MKKKKAGMIVLIVLLAAIAGVATYLRYSHNLAAEAVKITEAAPVQTVEPTAEPTPVPTAEPTPVPTVEPTPEPKREPVFTNDTDVLASAEIIKGFLEERTDNKVLICAIMGMFLRESKFYSYRVAHQKPNSEAWTAKIDEGLADGSTRDYFYNYTTFVSGGYGLCQWMGYHYCYDLYDFAQEWGTSIGDAEMQVAFMLQDLENSYPALYEEVTSTKSVYYAGAELGRLYERTASYDATAGNAVYFYEMYYKDSEESEKSA